MQATVEEAEEHDGSLTDQKTIGRVRAIGIVNMVGFVASTMNSCWTRGNMQRQSSSATCVCRPT